MSSDVPLCKRRKSIAVIGGAGPDAGLDLTQKIIEENRTLLDDLHQKGKMQKPYESDRDAPQVVLFQVPGVGGPRASPLDLLDESRPAYQLVWESLVDTVKKIDAVGCDSFCMSCNTLHLLEGKMQDFCAKNSIKAKFVSLVRETARSVEDGLMTERDPKRQKTSDSCANGASTVTVCPLGSLNVTDVCAESGKSPYRQAFAGNSEVRLLELPDGDRQALQNLLRQIKLEGVSGEAGSEKAMALVDILRRYKYDSVENPKGANMFVLGCTELPLLIPELTKLNAKGKLPVKMESLLDPGRIMARKLMEQDFLDIASKL